MSALWNNLLYQPIYNLLVLIVNNITFGDVGFAVILVTIIVKLILSPLAVKSTKSQIMIKKIEPELNRIKKDYPNKEEQAQKTMDLYKKHKINPMSGCLVVILQMPIIFALYHVFQKGLLVNTETIYSFVRIPEFLNTNFLGFIDLAEKSILLGVFAGLGQFVQAFLLSRKKKEPEIEIVSEVPKKEEIKTPVFQDQMAKSMETNMKYFLPVLIGIIASRVSAIIALYFITTSVFSIIQDLIIRRKIEKKNG